MIMDIAAIASFRSVDRFLADPGIPSAQLLHGAGHENTRILMRREAAEANGWLFERWEWIQLITGLSLFLVLVFGQRPPKIPIGICLLMLVLVLVERLSLTPNIIRLGRLVDFLPAGPQIPDRVQFGLYHNAYSVIDIVKIVMGFAIAGILILRRPPDPELFAREAQLEQDALPPRGSAL
jgi:hypothetical protein